MIFFAALLILNFSITPPPEASPVIRARYVMGTLCEITAYGPRAVEGVEAAFTEIDRLDRLLSVYKENSEVSALNRAAGKGPVPVSEDLWNLLELSARISGSSGGAFDPTYASPVPARGMARLTLDPALRRVSLPPEARLDFGAVGKGYALDAAAAVLRARGAHRALLNFGGQLLALDPPPGADAWETQAAGRRIGIANASIAVSGFSEQPDHILDPRAGAPARDRGEAAAAARSAAEADAWSTALFVLGSAPGAFKDCALFRDPDGAERSSGDCGRIRFRGKFN